MHAWAYAGGLELFGLQTCKTGTSKYSSKGWRSWAVASHDFSQNFLGSGAAIRFLDRYRGNRTADIIDGHLNVVHSMNNKSCGVQ